MNEKRNILAFDTALGGISVGVVTAAGQEVMRQKQTQREQAALLIPMIQDALDEAGITFKDIDLIGAVTGPGSFTGLRIGLCTARVLAMTLQKTIVGVTSLEMMAQQYISNFSDKVDNSIILIALETKRQDFYACYYDFQGNALCNPMATGTNEILACAKTLSEHDTIYVGGDCLTRFQEAISKEQNQLHFLPEEVHIDPIKMAYHVNTIYDKNGSSTEPIQPLYLRDADVSQPKNPPRQLRQN